MRFKKVFFLLLIAFMAKSGSAKSINNLVTGAMLYSATNALRQADSSRLVLLENVYSNNGNNRIDTAKDIRWRQNKSNFFYSKAPSKGFFISVMGGPTFSSNFDATIALTGGMYLAKFASIGLGVQAMKYRTDNDVYSKVTLVPIFFEARFFIPKRFIAPMFSIQFGYAFVANRSLLQTSRGYLYEFNIPTANSSGVYGSISLGLQAFISEKIAIVAEVSPAFFEYDAEPDPQSFESTRSLTGTIFQARLGVRVLLSTKQTE